MSELLIDTTLDEDQRECAENIHRSANGLLTVINDILDLSKVESGRLDIEVCTISFFERPFEASERLASCNSPELVSELSVYPALFGASSLPLECGGGIANSVEGSLFQPLCCD